MPYNFISSSVTLSKCDDEMRPSGRGRLAVRTARACAVPVLVIMGLSGCTGPTRPAHLTDSQCVRWEMAHGADQTVQLRFRGAASACQAYDHSANIQQFGWGKLPLDLRDDPGLQAMAENPAQNTGDAPFIPSNSSAPPTGPRWNRHQQGW